MKSGQKLLRCLLWVALCSGMKPGANARAQDLDKSYAEFPREVQIGGDDYAGDAFDAVTISAFNTFSWRSFVALNWPATNWPSEPQRGLADTSLGPSDLSRPRVWETWKAGYEVIPNQPATGSIVHPLSWNSVDDATPVGGITKTFPKVLGSFTKFGDISQADFGFFAGPLVCQNHTYTHFEVRMNRVEYSTIVGEGFYLKEIVDAHLGDPTQQEFQFPPGSVTVKASWRELDPSYDDLSTYYTRRARVLNYATGGSDERTVGLVGMHIVHKTPLRKQWVWSSFEHKSNVPGPAASGPYSFNNGMSTALSPKTNPVGPSNPYVQPTPDPALPAAEVVRVSPLHPQTVADNATFHALLPASSVWRNYHLVLTHWPRKPDAAEDPVTGELEGKPFPREPQGASTDLNVSNTTLETWQQEFSCIRCHETAESQGFDYVFFPIVHAKPTPGMAAPAPHVADFLTKLNTQFDAAAVKSRENNSKRNSR